MSDNNLKKLMWWSASACAFACAVVAAWMGGMVPDSVKTPVEAGFSSALSAVGLGDAAPLGAAEEIFIPEGETYDQGSAALGSKVFSGPGTLRIAQAATTRSTGMESVLSKANFSDSFTGVLELGAGRYETDPSASLPDGIALRVRDGAQFCVRDSKTFNGTLYAEGDGWGGEGGYAVSHAPLRLGINAYATGDIHVVSNAAIGVFNNTAFVTGRIVASDGFRKVGGGAICFPNPNASMQDCGTATVEGGTLRLGTGVAGTSGVSAGSVVRAGSRIVVKSGASVNTWLWTAVGQSYLVSDKVRVATEIVLESGGKLYTQDGAYHFDSLVCSGEDGSTFALDIAYRKGWTFGRIVVPRGTTLNANLVSGDSRKALVGIFDAFGIHGTLSFNGVGTPDVSGNGSGVVKVGYGTNWEFALGTRECRGVAVERGSRVNMTLYRIPVGLNLLIR